MPKKLFLIIGSLTIVFLFFIYRIYDLAYMNRNFYLNEARKINEVYVSGGTAPRGRILDVNGTVLVDNIGINAIYYHKPSNITLKEELVIAETLVNLTNYQYQYDENKLKDFYLIKYSEECNTLITIEEYEMYNERKLSKEDLC